MHYDITGLRRAGKSCLLYQHIQDLVDKGQSMEEMLFVNFEDERIADMPKEQLHLVLDAYYEMYPHRPTVFLDEIQNIKGWEHFVRRLADEGYMVYVTGSNSHMLSKEMATVLGGRFLTIEVWPFSFSEFLDIEGVACDANWLFSPVRNDVRRLLPDYFMYGGFAETFPLLDKRGWLTSLFNKVLLSDVMLRKDIRSEQTMSLLVKKLVDSLMQPVGIKRLHDLLRADGTAVVRSTVQLYLSYLEEAFLTFHLENFTSSVAERASMRKYYFRDNGLLNLFLIDNKAKLLENLVAITLFKRYGEGLCYYRQNIEVDFYVPEINIALQASYVMDNTTIAREVKALVALHKFRPLDRAVIVTYEEEDRIVEDGLTIEVVPLAEWLLEQDRS